MPATPISTVTRYWSVGTAKWYFCSSIANKSAPSRAELNAGTDLTGEVNSVEGWTVSSELIEVPDANTAFKSKIPGAISAEDSSLTLYADASGSDVRTLLPRNTAGFIVRLGGGDTAGRKMDVFPVKVSSVSKMFGSTEEEGARVTIQFAITSEPAEDVTIPA